MKEISVKRVEDCISKMVQNINFEYPSDVLTKLAEGLAKETSKIGKETLQLLMENAHIAKTERIPICQDTGMVIVFLKVGQEVGWNMSFVEQLGPEANDKYVSNLDTYLRRQEEMKSRNEENEEK